MSCRIIPCGYQCRKHVYHDEVSTVSRLADRHGPKDMHLHAVIAFPSVPAPGSRAAVSILSDGALRLRLIPASELVGNQESIRAGVWVGEASQAAGGERRISVTTTMNSHRAPRWRVSMDQQCWGHMGRVPAVIPGISGCPVALAVNLGNMQLVGTCAG